MKSGIDPVHEITEQ